MTGVQAQTFTASNLTYTQDFNSLASSGTSNVWTDNTTLPGWLSNRTVYQAGTGSNNAGSLYSFGSASSTERALGSVASGSAQPVYGVVLTNGSGTPISSLTITYTGEQWRNGGNTTQQKLSFSYSTGATVTLASAATAVATLDFTGPIATATAAALDGNLAANRVALTEVITFATPVANGEQVLLRWTDVDDPGADHGLAVDDLSVIAGLTVPPATLTANPTTLSGFAATQGQASAPQVYTLTGSNLNTNASVSASAGFEVSTDGSAYATTATVPQTGGALSQTIAVRLSNTAPVGAVSGTITNVSGSATATVTTSGNVTAPTPGKIVISQVYGGGGNSGATFTNDFIELFNAGGTTVNVSTWSVQYAGATGTSWQSTTLTGNIAPGKYYLVQQAAGAGGTTALPAADAIGNIAMSATAGKVALVNTTVALSGSCPVDASIIDFVGFGTTATCFEGSGATPAPSNTNAVLRASNGCTDTDNNATDFTTGAPSPRNSASPTNLCAPAATPFITATPSPVSLSYTVGGGPVSQVVTVNASNLTPAAGSVTVSSSSTAVTVSPASLAYTGGSLSGATFTAQLVAGLPVGSYPATLTLTNGTTSTTLAVNGTVKAAAGTLTLISVVQGNGPASPLAGQTVTIEGIVTRVFATTATGLGGFYVQEEDADNDNDPATSEGIFVYDPNVFFAGTTGDKVRLTGAVSEFFDLTQITLSGASSLTNLGANTLPTVTPLVFPVTSVDMLEQYEGMLVVASAASGNLTVTETFELGRFGRVVLSSTGPGDVAGTDPRLDQYTQFNAPSVPGYAAYLADVAKRTISLDDGRDDQNPPQIVFGRGGQPLSATNTLRGGDNITSITAILDYRRGAYRLESATGLDFQPTNPRSATPPAVGGTLKAGSFNVLNYFNTFGTANFTNCAGNSIAGRGADNAQEFTRQRDKTIRAIINSGVDVMALNEMQNNGFGANSALQNLVNGLNEATAPGTYTFVNSGCISTDAITVAMIYKPASITTVGLAASLSSSSAFNSTGRQPLAQTFRQLATGGVFTLVANHWKSKGGTGTGSDADINDGQGAFNGLRTQQAQDLVAWLATKPTGTTDPDYLIVGDLNSYAKEDPLTALETGGYINLVPNTTYSYIFGGFVGALDHALGSASLPAQVTNATKWHINADEPIILDYNTNFKSAEQVNSLYNAEPYRASDHDPVIIGLNLTPSLSATLVASTSVCAGSPASFSLIVAGLATGATYSYTITNGTNSTTASGVSASAVQTSVVPTVAGSFTATVLTSTNASTTAASGTVTINALPTNASLTSGTLTCTATSVTLIASATGGVSYTLNGGLTSQSNTTGQFVVSTAGNYTAIIANGSGCTATATATVTSNTTTPTATLTASSMSACSPASITLTAGGGTSYTFSAGATQIGSSNQAIVTQSGTYSVTVSNASGCTATASTSVTVSQPPAAPTLTNVSRTVNQSNTPLPLGQFVSAMGSNTLSFSGVNGMLNPPNADISQPGVQSFTVTQTNASGCVSPATTFTITVQQSVTTSPGSQTVCRSSTVVLNATTPGTRYEWYKNGQTAANKLTEIASSQKGTATSSLTLVSIQTTADYYVKVFQANGSFVFDGPFRVTVNYGCTAPGGRVTAAEIAEVSLSVTLFPNPVVDGQLKAVVRGAGGQALSMELVDLRGQVVRSQRWAVADDAQSLEWDVRSQSSGLYLMRVQAGGQTTTVKVIKQ